MIPRTIAWLSAFAWIGLFFTQIWLLDLWRELGDVLDQVAAAVESWIWPAPARPRLSGNSWRAQPFDEIVRTFPGVDEGALTARRGDNEGVFEGSIPGYNSVSYYVGGIEWPPK